MISLAKEKIKKVEVGFGGITADLKHGFVNNIIDLCERTYLPFMIVENRLWQKQLDSFREQLSSKIDTFVTNEDVFKIYPQMLAKPLLPVFLPYTDTYNHYYDFRNRFIGSRDNYRETAMLLGERQFNYYYNLHIWNTKDGYERNRSYLKGLISSAQEKTP